MVTVITAGHSRTDPGATGDDEFVPGVYTSLVIVGETGDPDSTEMTGTYPTGTTSICGNPL